MITKIYYSCFALHSLNKNLISFREVDGQNNLVIDYSLLTKFIALCLNLFIDDTRCYDESFRL